jgi:hypothetical protein
MVALLMWVLLLARSRFKSRGRLEAENIALRQQLIVLTRRSRRRARLRNFDRLLLVWLYRLCPSVLDAILIIKPETLIRWHRRGFRAYGTGSLGGLDPKPTYVQFLINPLSQPACQECLKSWMFGRFALSQSASRAHSSRSLGGLP